MDGVGKTTVSEKLAEILNFKLVEKPLHYLFDEDGEFTNYVRIRDYINEQIDNDVLRAWFYGLGNIYLLHRFKNVNIITDRHFVSNYYWCGSKRTECIFKDMIDLIGKPDYTFLLFASAEVGEKRIKNRNPNDPDINKTKLYLTAKKKMESFLRKYEMKYSVIDTTNLNADEVVEMVIKALPSEIKRQLHRGDTE